MSSPIPSRVPGDVVAQSVERPEPELVQVGVYHNGVLKRDICGNVTVEVPAGMRPYEPVYTYATPESAKDELTTIAPTPLYTLSNKR